MTANGAGRREGTVTGPAGVLFVGCLMIGLAVGILTGEVAVATLAGLGVGFFALALAGGSRRSRSAGGLMFTGCLFVGIALGLLLGNAAVGVLAGLGCGFILMYLVGRGTGEV